MADALQESFAEFVSRSVARPGISRSFEATGIRIHYLEWPGPPGAPALLLLHGFLGHAHWWDFIAPWLSENHRVIAPDFGGMGDSGYRKTYQHEHFVDEIGALIQHARITPCTVIGHSFGGRAALLACREYSNAILRGIIVDSRIETREDPLRGLDEQWRAKTRYASREQILQRFRLQPHEPAPAPALEHLAQHSVREDKGAWVWKFDEHVTQLFRARKPDTPREEAESLTDLPMPIDIIRGEHSKVVTAARAARLAGSIRSARAPIVIPTAHHHVPIGQPLALLAALRALLSVPN